MAPCRRTMGRTLTACLTAAGVLGLTQAASAQAWLPQTPKDMKAVSMPRGQQAAPPAALPGAGSGAGTATQGNPAAADMKPNDALFDAVNRGDIAGVRDALTRGADVNAVNVLGLTPVDLSVDLSRNDITFLLLSQRSGGGGAGGTAAGTAPGTKAAAAPTTGKTGAPVRTAAADPPRSAVPSRPVVVAPPRRQVVSNDPGVPAPQAGFLGFGGTAQ
jgi:hypothetical protein